MEQEASLREVERRVDGLELDDLRRRVKALEEQVAKLKPASGWITRLKDFAPILTPIVVALIGIYATTAIKGAIDRKQLELSQLTAIRELMVKLAAPDADLPTAEATAVALSAFGPPAIVPLIHELQSEGQTRSLAAERGLRTMAFQYPDQVCQALTQVLEDRSRLFAWSTHRHAIELLGQVGCTEAVPVLQGYRTMFESDHAVDLYKQRVSDDPEPNERAVAKLKDSVASALKQLQP